jgi:glycosyltransferase involved in cell wall biosynthesis
MSKAHLGVASDVSVLITACDAAEELAAILPSLDRAFEVLLVLDEKNSDETEKLAATFPNVRVVTRAYRSQADQLNWALESICTTPWVLVLDADERLEVDWRVIERLVGIALDREKSAVAFRRKNYFGKRWLKHGGFWPDWQVRLFRTELRYEPLPVHSHVIVNGRRQILFSRDALLRHNAYRDVDHYLSKLFSYVAFEDELIRSRNSSSRPRYRALRVLFDRLPMRPLVRFLYMYIFRLGILDGWPGFYIALWSAAKDTMVAGRHRLASSYASPPASGQRRSTA